MSDTSYLDDEALKLSSILFAAVSHSGSPDWIKHGYFAARAALVDKVNKERGVIPLTERQLRFLLSSGLDTETAVEAAKAQAFGIEQEKKA
jgi:hypothetical protein